MKSPSSPEPYLEKSISSGGAPPSAKAIYQQRKNYGRNVSEKGDVSEYKVEHLATFSMKQKEAASIVDESIHKLKLLDARGKVWSQEIFLNIDGKFVKLIDCDSREELENFSLGSLFHIQSVVNACNYNNICALLMRAGEPQTVDVHLFQCLTVSADVVRADIINAIRHLKSKKGQKNKPDTRHHEAASPASSLQSASTASLTNGVAQSTKADKQLSASNQQGKAQEILAFNINRDVEIFNHTLDDIELFVLLLQKSTIVSSEPPQRQSKRKSSKRSNKAPENGEMEMRKKLPPKEKFIDCLQKFRLCFNLLAKLKSQLKNPSSKELLHFIFQPLGMIIHTCCGPNLARQVRLPPFSQPTIEFIRSSANPQEINLWKSLGDFWTKFREEFPEDTPFPPYKLTFSSGWVPPALPPVETEDRDTEDQDINALPLVATGFILKAREDEIEDVPEPPSPPPVVVPAPIRQKSISNGRGSSKSLNVYQETGLTESPFVPPPVAPPRKVCRAMFDFTARNDRELSVKLNDLLDVLDDSKSWWKVKNKYGEAGFVPGNLMVILSSVSEISSASSTESPPDVFPPPPVFPIAKPKPEVVRAPSPPPMIPLPTRNPSPPPTKVETVPLATMLSSVKLRSAAFSKANENTDNRKKSSNGISEGLQEELRQRVESQKKRNFILPKKSSSSSDVVINKSSSRAQVRNWLQSHGFSRITVDSLAALDGAQIFSLKKEELKEISEDEGSRVYSKLLIQKSLDGFHTAKGNSELGKIMLKRLQEVEVDAESL